MRVKDISIEVRGDTAQELAANGILYGRKYGEAATIKLPCTVEGLKACKKLSILGHKTNMTLVFSTSQAILCSLAGATYISPFIGRMDDNSLTGLSLLHDICDVFEKQKVKHKFSCFCT